MSVDRKPGFATWALLTPSLVMAAVLLIMPLAIILAYSFSDRDAYGGIRSGFTLASYLELLKPVYWPIFINSLKIALFSTLVCLCVGYPIAWFIVFRAGRYATLLLALLLIPFWIDFMIRMSSWIVLMGYGGLINQLLKALGIIEAPLRIIGTYPAVMVGMLYAFLPMTVLPIYASLQAMDRRLLEAAQDLGAGAFYSFWRVTLPLSMPGVLSAILFIFIPSMGVYAIPVLLGGGKSIILGNFIVQLFLDFRNIPLGSAVSVVMLLFSSVVTVMYMRLLRRIEEARA